MKPKQIFSILVCLSFILICISCNWKQRDEITPDDIPDSISFSQEIIPIFNAGCNATNCHDGTYAPDLRTGNAYDALVTGQFINESKPDSSVLYLSVDGGTMDALATDEERAKILKWLREGAHNN